MEQHVLVVPVTGLLQVIVTEGEINPVAYLGERVGDLVVMSLYVGKQRRGTARWFHHPGGAANVRAQHVLLSLTGAYVVLTGDVVFTGMTKERVYDQVAKLSSRDETSDGRLE